MALPDLSEEERQAILVGETERAVGLAREALARLADVLACIDDGFGAGLREVRSLVGEER